MQTYNLDNLQLSSKDVVFGNEDQQTHLTLTNTHSEYIICFKVKTTKNNIIIVKPSKGYVPVNGKQNIKFTIPPDISPVDREKAANEMFLLQVVNINKPTLTQHEINQTWELLKQKKFSLQLGHGYYKFKIYVHDSEDRRSSFKPSLKVSGLEQPTFARLSPKISKSSKYDFQDPASAIHEPTFNHPQLSRKLRQLKRQQQQLSQERESILNASCLPKSKSNPKVWLLYALVLTFGYYIGFSLKKSFSLI